MARLLNEVRTARRVSGITQAEMARALQIARSNITRLEAGGLADVGVVRLSEIASVLGHELSVGLHPIGDPIRDKGQQACAHRFEAMLSKRWQVTDETLLPGPGEKRAWDKLLRLVGVTPNHLVGVDIESRAWDLQALVRRTRMRERDGRVDHILIVLADTAHNRRVIDELRHMLGDAYTSLPRTVLRQLRAGERLPGSGVVLL